MPPNSFCLELTGDFACFTSPVNKVERWSFPCPTPSAVRGIFDAIYCKPKEFRWQVDRIEILKPIRYIALRRNEVKDKASETVVKKWMKGTAQPEPLFADADKSITGTDQKGRTQRQTMALKDVAYRVYAHVIPWLGFENRMKGLTAQFARRAARGACVWQPYFGCREFPAYFRLVDAVEPNESPAPIDMDVGWMLYDVFDLAHPNRILHTGKWDKKEPNAERYVVEPSISVFYARIASGVVDIPPYASDAVRKGVEEAV